VTTG
jgi:hypothetical protein